MAHSTDPDRWFHVDSTGAYGPECDVTRASICSSLDAAGALPRPLAETIAVWVMDEGRPFRADPNLPRPGPELRARLAAIRRKLAEHGLNIRRDRGRRWWYLYRMTPRPARHLSFGSGSTSMTGLERAALERAQLERKMTPRAIEIVREVCSGRRRVRKMDAVDAVVRAMIEAMDDSIPF